MTHAPGHVLPYWRRRVGVGLSLVACIAGLAWASLSGAQGAPTPVPLAPKASAVEHGVHWQALKPAQQATLRPLEREWSALSAPQKQEWLKLSARFPKLTSAGQARVQDRMAEWARMTPQQRGQARLNFQEAKQMTVQDRQARWDAYEALSPERRQQFAARAAPTATALAVEAARKRAMAAARNGKSNREAPQAKSNIVPNPAFASPLKAVTPTVVQARPGATTTLITRRPAPPSHQHTGLPKIAATPEFVNRATLLPQRGPQGAATRPTRPVAASAVGLAPSR